MLPRGVEVGAPYWFLILLAAAFPVGVWFPWSTQFSLRTLLIVMTIVAGMLGLIIGLNAVSQSGFKLQEIRLRHGQIQFELASPESWRQFLAEMRTVDLFGFGWQSNKTRLWLAIPGWFVVLISVVLIAAAWIRWKSRFGARRLQIATTLFAVTLGLTFWMIS